jgi:hypothetical protein
MAQQLRESVDKWDYIKLKSFCITKEMVTRLKMQSIECGKIFASYIPGKGSVTRLYKKLKKLNSQKINNPMKKLVK